MNGILVPKGFPGLPDDWEVSSHCFATRDRSQELFFLKWSKKSPSSPKKILIILHGLSEHCGRYSHFPHYLQDAVDVIYCFDYRGHGRSSGIRGYVECFSDYVKDAKEFIFQTETSEGKDSEIHLLGHSMGGLVALRLLQEEAPLGLASVTLSAPLLEIKAKVPFVKHFAGLVLSTIWGSFQMPTDLDPALVSRDPEVVVVYKTDRLISHRITPKLYFGTLDALDEVWESDRELPYRIKFFIPDHDQIVDHEATLEFFDELRATKKEKTVLKGFYHEPFNDLGKEAVFGELKEWIRKNHLKKTDKD